MRKRRSTATFVVVLLAGSLLAWAGDVLDRIVATVNGHIILQSDWDDALSYEAFIGGNPLDQLSAEDHRTTLNRLIDQELLREQLRSTDSQHAPDDEDVTTRIQEVRKQYPDAQSDEGWKATLSHFGLTQDQLKRHVALQLDLMQLVDDRFRPTVQIDDKSIESYYNRSLLPQLRESGAKEVALADVTPKIRELLTQQKMDELVTAWLQTLRSASDIHTGEASDRSQAR